MFSTLSCMATPSKDTQTSTAAATKSAEGIEPQIAKAQFEKIRELAASSKVGFDADKGLVVLSSGSWSDAGQAIIFINQKQKKAVGFNILPRQEKISTPISLNSKFGDIIKLTEQAQKLGNLEQTNVIDGVRYEYLEFSIVDKIPQKTQTQIYMNNPAVSGKNEIHTKFVEDFRKLVQLD